MSQETKPFHIDWFMPVLAISLALTIAIGVGFLFGHGLRPVSDNSLAACGPLHSKTSQADCLALRSVEAAEASVRISGLALWVSFGSWMSSAAALIGLYMAYVQGQRTLRLANEANRISLESSQAQARAYVVIQSVECRLNEKGGFSVKTSFQNSGQTPARQVRWSYKAHLDLVLDSEDVLRVVASDDFALEKTHWRQDIASMETWVTTPTSCLPFPVETTAKLSDAKFIAVTVTIQFDYLDVFGVTHLETGRFQGAAHVSEGRFGDDFDQLDKAVDA